ncbi:HPr kinase [Bacillus cereus Rock3-44]|nr:HPr kinase [Bacillus cereus Rock3-44]
MVYKAFGLRIVSEIPLPELPQMIEQKDVADITIEIADLSGQWHKYAAEYEPKVCS